MIVAKHQQNCKVAGCKEPTKDSRGYCQNHIGGYEHMMEPVLKHQQKGRDAL